MRPQFLPLILPDGQTRYESRRNQLEHLTIVAEDAIARRRAATGEVTIYDEPMMDITRVLGDLLEFTHDGSLLKDRRDHVAMEKALLLVGLRRQWPNTETIWLDEDRFVKNDGNRITLYRKTDYIGQPVTQLGQHPLARLTPTECNVGWRVSKCYAERARKLVVAALTDAGSGI